MNYKMSQYFKFLKSCDVDRNVKVQIISLEGKPPEISIKEILENPSFLRKLPYADFIVELYLWSDLLERRISMTYTTTYKEFSHGWVWNEWIEIPIQYCEIPRDTKVVLTIYECQGGFRKELIGGSCTNLFGEDDSILKSEELILKVWPCVEGNPFSTPGELSESEASRLAKLMIQHEVGKVPANDWSDRLTFKAIEEAIKASKDKCSHMTLTIRFENFNIDLIWWDPCSRVNGSSFDKTDELVYFDPDLDERENWCEKKHRSMTRNTRAKESDKNEKPNPEERDILLRIANYPPQRPLNDREQDVLWRYRYFASTRKQLLTRFLRCIDFGSSTETKAGLEMLPLWEKPDPYEALELLGPDFEDATVRRYAVERLRQADSKDIELYLLYLVQALRYEKWGGANGSNAIEDMCSLSHYSITSNVSSAFLSTDKLFSNEQGLEESQVDALGPLSQQPLPSSSSPLDLEGDSVILAEQKEPPLATFLIERACEDLVLANYLFWYVSLQAENKKEGMIYETMLKSFVAHLGDKSSETRAIKTALYQQHQFVGDLVSALKFVCEENRDRLQKTEKLQGLFSSENGWTGFCSNNFPPLPLPLDPTVEINGVVPEKIFFFKSALEPCKLTFKTTRGGEYSAIFKNGDDLRQDQLIIQLFTVMEDLLQLQGLDLKLTPYKVLPTSCNQGFVQFIESRSVNEILHDHGSILSYLKECAPSPHESHGVSSEVLDTYIKSCAGYCVITYILGIGDRHFDNLLLTKNGNFFHIDFGYILGNDPKPFPAAIKLSKEMIEGMGAESNYREFQRHCFTAFTVLRKHTKLLLNLVSLMLDSCLTNVGMSPSEVLQFIKERLDPDNSEEEALFLFKNVLEKSAGAIFPAVLENIHRMAMYLRK